MKAARDARSAAVVINAGSRRGAAHELALDTMRKAGVPISAVHPVLSGADLAGTLDRVLADGHDLVVVGGGGGTVSYAAGRVAGTNVALGVLPLGTANDFARTPRLYFLGAFGGGPVAAAACRLGFIRGGNPAAGPRFHARAGDCRRRTLPQVVGGRRVHRG